MIIKDRTTQSALKADWGFYRKMALQWYSNDFTCTLSTWPSQSNPSVDLEPCDSVWSKQREAS